MNPPMEDECRDCQIRTQREAEEERQAARRVAEAARQAELEHSERERKARIAEQQAQTRLAGRRALALNAIPFFILLVAAVGLPLLSVSEPILAIVLPIPCGILAGRTVTRLIVVRGQQAPWKINLDAAFDWRSIWATIIVVAATGYLAWSAIVATS